MNPFEMVVLIVAIVVIGRIFASRARHRHGVEGDPAAAAENARLQNEIQQLKDRIATAPVPLVSGARSYSTDATRHPSSRAVRILPGADWVALPRT